MKLLVMKSLDDIECFDCPYNEYKSIFNWLVMTKGRDWVNELYAERMFYALCNTETESMLVLEERASYFNNTDYDWFIIVKPIEGEGNTAQLLIVVAQVIVVAVSAYFSFGATLGVWLSIQAAALTINAGLSYLSYRLSPHATMAEAAAGAEYNSNLFVGNTFTIEQGGVVPLIYGHAYAKGTIICSSITTTQG